MQLNNYLLVMTSSYPLKIGDTIGGGGFVYELVERLKDNFNITILTPYLHQYESSLNDDFNGYQVKRFQYFFKKQCNLTGTDGILPKIRKNSFNYIKLFLLVLFNLISLLKINRDKKFTIIHSHWIFPQGLVVFLYKKLFNKNIKYLLTIHGGDIFSFENKLGYHLKNRIINTADHITVVSDHIKQVILQKYYVNEDKISVYPMGIDTNLFSPTKNSVEIKKKFNITNELLLFVGYLSEKKGAKYLVKAMPSIIARYPNVKLLIVGDGDEKVFLEKLTKHLECDKNIIFTGSIENKRLPDFYSSADVFIGPSTIAKDGDSEGFGLVFAEAASSECFVITTDFPAMKDIIINKETGFIVKQKDAEDIAQKVIDILNNKKQYEGIKIKARQHIVKNFDWTRVATNYQKLIENLYE